MKNPLNQSNERVESLLKQMPLSAPSESLDERVEALFASDDAMGELELAGPVGSSKGLWWTILGLATAASLLTILMNLPVANSSEVTAFKQLHGHSTNLKFADCSDCHSFANKQEEVVDKWAPDEGHAKFGGNCKFCHVSADDENENGGDPPDWEHGIPPQDLELEAPLPFDQWHGHSGHQGFMDCASCHKGVEPDNLEPHWYHHDGLDKDHTDPEMNCALCHAGATKGSAP